MKKIKISKSTVDRLPFAPKGEQIDYFDSELKGFGSRVSATAKTYFVLKRVNGKLTRVTLGTHGVKTAEQARREAIHTLSDLGKGIDVNREKARAREKGITLSEVLDRYFTARQELKPRTVTTYRALFRLYLKDWMKQPIEHITKDMVAARHLRVAKKAGKAAANNVMRTLRAVYNFANELLDDSLPINPVKRLSNTRQWFTIERRQTVVSESDLPKWFAAVNKLENPIIRDYLLLLLFTGARRTETCSLKWEDVDLENKTFVLTKTKNGKPLPLPMSDYIHQLFLDRHTLRESDFVFPGRGTTGHLVESRRQTKLITKQTGIKFTLHDMRRTYTSAIDGIVGYYELKRLLNHSVRADDVTAGYVVKNTEKLRPLMQKVTDHILNLVQPKEPGKVIALDRKSGTP
ncbi:MAG: integrase family protein [Syntrophorhabdales bacterium]